MRPLSFLVYIPLQILPADIYSRRFLELGKKGVGKKTLEATDEGFGFGLAFDHDYEAELESFVRSESLELGQHDFLRAASEKGPFMVVAEMLVRG